MPQWYACCVWDRTKLNQSDCTVDNILNLSQYNECRYKSHRGCSVNLDDSGFPPGNAYLAPTNSSHSGMRCHRWTVSNGPKSRVRHSAVVATLSIFARPRTRRLIQRQEGGVDRDLNLRRALASACHSRAHKRGERKQTVNDFGRFNRERRRGVVAVWVSSHRTELGARDDRPASQERARKRQKHVCRVRVDRRNQ